MQALHEEMISCPYCGEMFWVLVDCSVTEQEYIEDCQVCCCPINFLVTVESHGIPVISVSQENE